MSDPAPLPSHSAKLHHFEAQYRHAKPAEQVQGLSLEPWTRPPQPASVYGEAVFHSADAELVKYGEQLTAEKSQAVQAQQAAAVAACRQLAEYTAVISVRTKLEGLIAQINDATAKASDLERRYQDAILRDEPVDQLEAQQAQAASELKRLKTLYRLVVGGSPDNSGYEPANSPVLQAAIQAYQTKAKEVFEQARRSFEQESAAREKDLMAEVERTLPVYAVQIAVERQHLGGSKGYFSHLNIPEAK